MSFQKWHEAKEGARAKHLVLLSGRQIQFELLQECKFDGCLENADFSAEYRKLREGRNLLICANKTKEPFNPKTF